MPYAAGEQSTHNILQRMGNHSRTNALAPISQYPGHRAQHANLNRVSQPLIAMRQTKCYGRKNYSERSALCEGHELSLQIAPKKSLLTNARVHRYRYPQGNFHAAVREEELDRAVRRSAVASEDRAEHHGDEQERHADSCVA